MEGSNTLRYDDFDKLRIAVTGAVVTATIDNPPLNLIDDVLFAELDRFTRRVEQDPDPMVVVFKSADPDFFIAHAQLSRLFELEAVQVAIEDVSVTLNELQAICERVRTMDKIMIAQVEGRAGGGGAELAMACDMRFGAIGKAVFSNPGVALGSMPGGGGTQYMPRLVGRARALELIVGALDLDAVTAEKWGYLNRALAPEEIDGYVQHMAQSIAASPRLAVRYAKQAVNQAHLPLEEGLIEECWRFQKLLKTEDYVSNTRVFLEVGAETRDGEAQMEALTQRVRERFVG